MTGCSGRRRRRSAGVDQTALSATNDGATVGTLRSFVPAAVYSEVVRLAPEIPAVAVVPDGDRTLRTEWMIAASRERLGVEPIVVPGGHCPHVSRPSDLARILTSALSAP